MYQKKRVRVISVSLGSSKRDKRVVLKKRGYSIIVERKGTDGSIDKAISLVKRYDGKVDCFGLGGTNLFVKIGDSKYFIRESLKIVSSAKKTPFVDGCGLKDTLERDIVEYLRKKKAVRINQKKVLVTFALDRFGMSEEFEKAGARMTYGDFIFVLGINMPVHSIKWIYFWGKLLSPIVTKLPLKYLYPTGKDEDTLPSNEKYEAYFSGSDIICGDFKYIKRYCPESLKDKTIITNTTTEEDVAFLKNRGLKTLITTTPRFNGRTFGTNVIQAMLVALSGKKVENVTNSDYRLLMKKFDIAPSIINFY